jgi:large subunit ribosomal protein L3
MKFILGKKIEMIQIFQEEKVVPVTKIKAGPCYVTQIKKDKNNQKNSALIQIGFEKVKASKIKKPQKHIAYRYFAEFPKDSGQELKVGQEIKVDIFQKGEKVNVQGLSKGKGFQGVVKRHGFHGAPASHGHKDQLRMPGSIGSTDAARVFKGKKMGGQMGAGKITVKNLEIINVLPEENILLVKGAVPGSRNSFLKIKQS